jgi:cytochrome P450
VVQAANVMRDPHGWLHARHRRFGDVFSSRFPYYGRVVYLAEPQLAKELLTGDPTLWHSGEATASILEPVLGSQSVLTLDEGEHMAQRKLLLPPFHGERVRRYGELMAELTAREVASWPLGEEIELRPRFQAITLEVILRTVFGVRDESQLELFRERITRLGDSSNLLAFFPMLRRRKVPFYRRFLEAREAADELIYGEIAERRAAPDAEERDDVLSLLLSARHEDGSPMSDVELRDELMTLLTAGHETTATALSWAVERLVRTPPALERTESQLEDDAWVDAVVRETLRVRPVITDIGRLLTRDHEVAGYPLPAGTMVLAAIGAMHVREDVWDDPHAFRPERFLEDGAGEGYTWLPFGGGVRRCLGASFAQMEMRIVLREVLRRVRLRAASPEDERARLRHVTVVPGDNARVIASQREAPTTTTSFAPRPASETSAAAASTEPMPASSASERAAARSPRA